MTGTRLALAGVTLAAGAGLMTAPATGVAQATTPPGHPTLVRSTCLGAHYEPTYYVIACADANSLLTHVSYSSWHRHSAHGTATFRVNDCTPYCAAGTFHDFPASVHLFRERTVAGVPLFTRIRVDYTRDGHAAHDVTDLVTTAG